MRAALRILVLLPLLLAATGAVRAEEAERFLIGRVAVKEAGFWRVPGGRPARRP